MVRSNLQNQVRLSGFLFFFIPLMAFVWIGEGKFKTIEFQNTPEKVCVLPDNVNETSGIIYFNDAIWTFNDSGGKPELYQIDEKSGKINKAVIIDNAKNIDWEDITMDQEFIYIGDFGNNWGIRKNLVIYKISQKDITSGKSKVYAEVIHISYADQVSFEKMNRNHNFDCESVICYGDSLILFSKNWADNKTRMYKLSKEAGNYELSPLDSFNAGGLITGADYNEDTQKLVLIGYEQKVPFIYVMAGFNGFNFDSEEITKIEFPHFARSQTEGICWIDNNNVMISTEETKVFSPGLYKLDIDKIINPE